MRNLFMFLARRVLPKHMYHNLMSLRQGSRTRYSRHSNGLIRANDGEHSIVFYTWRRAGRYRRNGIGRVYRGMIEKYVPDWYELRPDCTVVDIGSNIGEFSMAIAPRVGQVIAFEPDKHPYSCLKENSALSSGVIHPYNMGISSQTGRKTLYVSSETADTSFIEPEQYSETVEIETYALAEFFKKTSLEVDEVDLIKIEAEGYEPEVVEGCLPHLRVKYYSVNCDPERYGKSPLEDVRATLEENGYRVVVKGYKVYGVLDT